MAKAKGTKELSITVEQATTFLRKFGVDIMKLGLLYLPDEAGFKDANYHHRWFEDLRAEVVAREGQDPVVRITGKYGTRPKESNQFAKGDPTEFHPCPDSYTPISLEVALDAECGKAEQPE